MTVDGTDYTCKAYPEAGGGRWRVKISPGFDGAAQMSGSLRHPHKADAAGLAQVVRTSLENAREKKANAAPPPAPPSARKNRKRKSADADVDRFEFEEGEGPRQRAPLAQREKVTAQKPRRPRSAPS